MGKILVFDLGGVLMEHDIRRCIGAFKYIMRDNFGKLGLGTDGEGEALMGDYERGLVSTEQFIDGILAWCVPGTSREEVVNAWNSMHAGIPERRLDVLRSLRRDGWRMYLLSNNNELHWQDVLRCVPDFDVLFDDVFLSFREHVSKPDARLFNILMERTGVLGEDIIFVDDLTGNRQAAESVGWQTCDSLETLEPLIEAIAHSTHA